MDGHNCNRIFSWRISLFLYFMMRLFWETYYSLIHLYLDNFNNDSTFLNYRFSFINHFVQKQQGVNFIFLCGEIVALVYIFCSWACETSLYESVSWEWNLLSIVHSIRLPKLEMQCSPLIFWDVVISWLLDIFVLFFLF